VNNNLRAPLAFSLGASLFILGGAGEVKRIKVLFCVCFLGLNNSKHVSMLLEKNGFFCSENFFVPCTNERCK
jgi:hypothetical protein